MGRNAEEEKEEFFFFNLIWKLDKKFYFNETHFPYGIFRANGTDE